MGGQWGEKKRTQPKGGPQPAQLRCQDLEAGWGPFEEGWENWAFLIILISTMRLKDCTGMENSEDAL